MTTETVPFQLQFDKPISSQIKIAEWNPEKDLLAMVTEDSKLVLHRFNWQRLWTVSTGKGIATLCWRPDGKALAVGLEDGAVSLYDVENGKLLRSIKLHTVAIACLSWEEDAQTIAGDRSNLSTYEDRTSRFFPPPPRSPRMPGLVPGDSGFLDDSEDSFQELSTSCQRFNILCSGDTDGNLCFSIFGIFPIGKINIHSISLRSQIKHNHVSCQLLNASIRKVALSKDLCNLVVLCSGEVPEPSIDSSGLVGFHCLVLDTSMFWNRKSELYQVALQASSIDDMIEVIRASFSVMLKQWNDAMRAFHEKFNSLSVLIANYGLDSTPQEEFLSLLGGARISPALHQFLVQSMGEAGLKRMEKLVSGAGKELQLILLDHVQPAAEIIGFRMGELRGFSRWRARYQSIGLDEKLIEYATEKAGMFLVQVERFMKVLSSVVQQFSNFFSWLLKATRTLMSEPSDQLLPFSSELVIVFLKFLYDQDPLKQLLESSEIDSDIRVDYKTAQRVRELVHFGGFSDTDYLRRTLAEEFQQMVSSFKEAFDMPFVTMSKKILCKDLIPLFPLDPSQGHVPSNIAASLSIYKDTMNDDLDLEQSHERMTGYMLFKIPDESFSNMSNCIGIARGFVHGFGNSGKGEMSLEAALFSVPNGFNCVDLSLYKEGQIALLLNETATSSESSGGSRLMLVQARDLPFASLSNSSSLNSWKLNELVGSAVHLQSENERVREIPHSVVAPLSVSASRGVACVFAARKRALVYILEEDEDEDEDEMSDSE